MDASPRQAVVQPGVTPRVVAGRVGGARGQLGVSVADAVEVPSRRGAFRGSLATSSGGGATETVTVTFTPARPVVTLSDPAAATRVSTGTFTTFVAPFRVRPADAVCTYRRIWDTTTPASVGLNGNSGADRSLRVIAVGTGEVIIDVRCAASGLAVTERVLFTVLSRTVDPLTIDKLSALMLAVPVHELQRSSPSPMFLGRSDNLRWNTRNEWLYSRNTREDERRAHWHAGVGLWQLDPWPPVRALNHAERADIAVGGAVVAAYIRDEFCEHSGQPLWEREVFGPWLACRDGSNPVRASRDLCPPTYRGIYDEAGDSMWVIATEGSQSDGGVEDRLCIWSDRMPLNYERGFGCFLYDPERHEGEMDVRSMEGTDSAARPNGLTPLAVAFISLTNPDGTHAGTKYAVFPAVKTGYAHTLIKAVAQATEARASRLGPDSNGWYVGVVDRRSLYVREGTNEQCAVLEAATLPVCGWTRM